MAMTEDSVSAHCKAPCCLVEGHDRCSNRRRETDVYIPLRRPAQPALRPGSGGANAVQATASFCAVESSLQMPLATWRRQMSSVPIWLARRPRRTGCPIELPPDKPTIGENHEN